MAAVDAADGRSGTGMARQTQYRAGSASPDHKISRTIGHGRVPKACVRCHSRKVKCDGAEPCSRCEREKLTCEYDREPKPRKRRRRKHEMPVSGAETDDTTAIMATDTGRASATGSASATESASATGGPADLGVAKRRRRVVAPPEAGSEPFTNAAFTLFSPRGIKCMVTSLRFDDKTSSQIFSSYQNIIRQFQTASAQTMASWIDPHPSLLPLSDKPFCLRAIDFYFEGLDSLTFIISKQVAHTYAARYYDHKLPGGPLTLSEMLILDMLVLQGTYACMGRPGGDIFGLPRADACKFSRQLVLNAIFLYHKIAVTGDGIEGIQGLLLFTAYCQNLPARTNPYFMLVSTTVRLAQEMGLHRREAYFGLPIESIRLRLNLWWSCYSFDKRYCMISGKPPVISDSDMSVIFPMDFIKVGVSLMNDADCSVEQIIETTYAIVKYPYSPISFHEVNQVDLSKVAPAKYEKVLDMLREPVIQENCGFLAFYGTGLSRITSTIYTEFLAPKASSQPRTFASFQQSVDSLNTELEFWRRTLPVNLRPCYQSDLDRLEADKNCFPYIELVFVHLTYYGTLILINRLTSLTYFYHWNIKGYQRSELTQTSNNTFIIASAVRILQLAIAFARAENRFVSKGSLYLLTAIVTLFTQCLKDPFQDDIKFYVELIVSFVKNVFGPASTNVQWPPLVSLMQLTAYVAAKYYRYHHKVDKISDNDDLNAFVDSLVPSRFTEPIDVRSVVNPLYTFCTLSSTSGSSLTDSRFYYETPESVDDSEAVSAAPKAEPAAAPVAEPKAEPVPAHGPLPASQPETCSNTGVLSQPIDLNELLGTFPASTQDRPSSVCEDPSDGNYFQTASAFPGSFVDDLLDFSLSNTYDLYSYMPGT